MDYKYKYLKYKNKYLELYKKLYGGVHYYEYGGLSDNGFIIMDNDIGENLLINRINNFKTEIYNFIKKNKIEFNSIKTNISAYDLFQIYYLRITAANFNTYKLIINKANPTNYISDRDTQGRRYEAFMNEIIKKSKKKNYITKMYSNNLEDDVKISIDQVHSEFITRIKTEHSETSAHFAIPETTRNFHNFLNDFKIFLQNFKDSKGLFNFINYYITNFGNYLNDFLNKLHDEDLIKQLFVACKCLPLIDTLRLHVYASLPPNIEGYNNIQRNPNMVRNFNNQLQIFYDEKCKQKNPRSSSYNCRKKV
jgi:hypothetical protein